MKRATFAFVVILNVGLGFWAGFTVWLVSIMGVDEDTTRWTTADWLNEAAIGLPEVLVGFLLLTAGLLAFNFVASRYAVQLRAKKWILALSGGGLLLLGALLGAVQVMIERPGMPLNDRGHR